MPFTPIGNTLKDNSENRGNLKSQVMAAKVLEVAKVVLEDMFGRDLAYHANPLFLKNRTLTISCASSAISQEIRLNQAQIVEKINKKTGTNEVDRIRYLA